MNVRVLAVHVVREDDDLEDVRVYRFAEVEGSFFGKHLRMY